MCYFSLHLYFFFFFGANVLVNGQWGMEMGGHDIMQLLPPHHLVAFGGHDFWC